jgi:hypothetical protein
MSETIDYKVKDIRSDVKIDNISLSPELEEVQSYMPIDKHDRDLLKKDIETNGLREPVKAYIKDRKFFILTGFNRLEILRELNYKSIPVEVVTIPEEKRKQLAIDDNLNRRHFTQEQKEQLINLFLITSPELSNRAIADKTKTSHNTVKKKKDILIATGQIDQLKKTIGKDGKSRTVNPKKTVVNKPAAAEPVKITDKEHWWTPEMEANKQRIDKVKSRITIIIQGQIDRYEDYIKQCNKAKKEKERNEAAALAYQVSISDLKELLQKILKEVE